MPTVTMTYGDYSFSPVPIISTRIEDVRNKEGKVGRQYVITLDGTLSTSPDLSGGISNVDTLMDSLESALSTSGKKFVLACDGSPLLICYPKVGPLQFSPTTNNWVYTAKYQVEITFEDYHGEDNAPYLESKQESWTVEAIADNQGGFPSYYHTDLSSVSPQEGGYDYSANDKSPFFLKVSHSLNAVGVEHYESGVGPAGITGVRNKEAWEYAKDWVIGRLGFESGVVQESGVLNFDVSDYGIYNHGRITKRSETDGSFGCDESWVVAVSGSGSILNATENFTININKSEENDISSVTINGEIQGLETRSYGSDPGDFSISESKIGAAESYWSTIKTRLLPRAQYYASGETSRDLNVLPLTETVGKSPTNGNVAYSYVYDDRPSNCVSGAKTESITIADDNECDLFTSIPIMGRYGPIHQDLGATTATSRTISVNCVMSPATGCGPTGLFATNPKTQVASLLCLFQTELTNGYSQVFKQSDNENWEPKLGRYSRQVVYVYQNCSGSGNTSLC